jgi:hypothetical protein
MSRKAESITLSCSLGEKASLEALAQKFHCVWGDRPNISALIKAIANENILLSEASPDLKLKAEIKRLELEVKEKKAKLK